MLRNKIKKIVALGLCALMPTMTLAGTYNLGDLPKPFIDDNGEVNAYVVIGTPTNPIPGYVNDVVGAIEVAAALAQKATTKPKVTLTTESFKGSEEATSSLQSSIISVGDLSDAEGRDILKNTTYTDKNGNDWYSVQNLEISNFTLNPDGTITIPENAIKYYVGLRDSEGNLLDLNQQASGDSEGKSVYILGEEYKLLYYNTTNPKVIGTGTIQDFKVTVFEPIKLGAKTITVLGLSEDKVHLSLSGETETTELLGIGDKIEFENLTIEVKSIFAGVGISNVDLKITQLTKELAWKEELKPGWELTWDLEDKNYIYLTNLDEIKLKENEKFQGPENYFELEYAKLESEIGKRNATINIRDGFIPDIKLTWTSNKGCKFENSLGIVGDKYWAGKSWEGAQYITRPEDIQTDWFRIVEPDSTFIEIDCNLGGEGNNFIIWDNTSIGGTRIALDRNIETTLSKNLKIAISDIGEEGGIYSWNITFKLTGINIEITDPSNTKTDWYIRPGLEGIYGTVGELNREWIFNSKLEWDGEQLTIVEPDGNEIIIKYTLNETTNNYQLSETNIENDTDTEYGSHWTEYNLIIPSKKATLRIGEYSYSNPVTLTVGDKVEIGETTIRVEELEGMSLNPVEDLGKTTEELKTIDKNVILVGGPEANSLVAELGITSDQFKENGKWAEGKALIKLINDAFEDKEALIIAGTRAEDTRAACKYIANQLHNNSLTGNEIWLTL